MWLQRRSKNTDTRARAKVIMAWGVPLLLLAREKKIVKEKGFRLPEGESDNSMDVPHAPLIRCAP